MILEALIREALSPDPLEEAKSRVQTRRYSAILKERRDRVHAALKKSVVPSRGASA
jgi:hypothetical protein